MEHKRAKGRQEKTRGGTPASHRGVRSTPRLPHAPGRTVAPACRDLKSTRVDLADETGCWRFLTQRRCAPFPGYACDPPINKPKEGAHANNPGEEVLRGQSQPPAKRQQHLHAGGRGAAESVRWPAGNGASSGEPAAAASSARKPAARRSKSRSTLVKPSRVASLATASTSPASRRISPTSAANKPDSGEPPRCSHGAAVWRASSAEAAAARAASHRNSIETCTPSLQMLTMDTRGSRCMVSLLLWVIRGRRGRRALSTDQLGPMQTPGLNAHVPSPDPASCNSFQPNRLVRPHFTATGEALIEVCVIYRRKLRQGLSVLRG
jgi:hypothetical protein